MSEFVTIVSEPNKIREQVLHELDLIESVINKGLPCLIQSDTKPETISWAPSVLGMTVRGGIRGTVRRVVLDACKRAEAVGPGSSELVLYWIVQCAKDLIVQIISGQDSRECEEKLQKAAGEFLENKKLVAKWLPKNAFQNQIEQTSRYPKATSIVWNAMDLAGMESRIFVDSEPSENCVVEQTRGFHFDVGPYEDMLKPGERWSERNVRVVVIDGMIETVSEIHKVLDPSSRDVEPVVIFARGFAEEVIATLNVNRLRQTLNVIPVRVPFDEFSANTIKDLGVVCNAHIVSSLTGELISQQKFEDLEVVDRITFTQGKTQIENEKGILGASLLSLELTEKRKEAKSAELIGLLDYRLRSLTSRSVRIRYDEDFRSQITEIDLLLRTSRAILDAGVIDLTQVEDVVPACLQSAFQSVIGKSRTPKSVPTLTLLSTVKYGTQAAVSLLSINAALLIDEE